MYITIAGYVLPIELQSVHVQLARDSHARKLASLFSLLSTTVAAGYGIHGELQI